MTTLLNITVVYSPAPRQVQEKALAVRSGGTVLQALQQADMLDIALAEGHTVGIWGKKTSPTHPLEDQDRIEIYRPLKVDPKVARRERFQKQGAKSKSAGLFAKRRVGAKAGY
ncbi:MAG TPA: RnfH family protein [Burkholderiaceae bacterium]|nr:RnfH family protein [Burkholderiaceae bacterium]